MLANLFALFIAFASSSVLGYLLEYPGDCSKYQECDGSIGGCYVRDCGPGTEFNPNIGSCDWPLTNRVGCGNRLNQISSGGTYQGGHIFLPYPDDCTKYQECDKSLGGCYVRDCGPGTEFNPNINNCDWPIASRTDCGNRLNKVSSARGTYQGGHVFLPYPGDCTKYQECDKSLGGCYVKDCGPGTEFNPNINNCDWPIADRTDCGNRLNQVSGGGVYQGYKGGHVLLPIPGDCTKYRECDKSLSNCQLRECVAGTEFNPHVNHCDLPLTNRVGCKNRYYQG